MAIDKSLQEALDVANRLKDAGDRVTRATVAKRLGISREAATHRLRRLYDLGLLPRNPISARPIQVDVKDMTAAARIAAVRDAARQKGELLTSEELDQVLKDCHPANHSHE